MASTTVRTVVSNAKRVLQEVMGDDGIRWTNAELIAWLNDAYPAIVQIKPDAGSVNAEVELVAGTRQSIPDDGLRLLDVGRNTHNDSNGMGIMPSSRQSLDRARRGWHRDPETRNIEQYVFEDTDPTHFYVYPPAREGAAVEIIYAAVPEPHDASAGLDGVGDETIHVSDAYAPILTDYVLYRAFSKDAEHAANLQRAQMHRQAYMNALGQKAQVDLAHSPNAKPQQQG